MRFIRLVIGLLLTITILLSVVVFGAHSLVSGYTCVQTAINDNTGAEHFIFDTVLGGSIKDPRPNTALTLSPDQHYTVYYQEAADRSTRRLIIYSNSSHQERVIPFQNTEEYRFAMWTTDSRQIIAGYLGGAEDGSYQPSFLTVNVDGSGLKRTAVLSTLIKPGSYVEWRNSFGWSADNTYFGIELVGSGWRKYLFLSVNDPAKQYVIDGIAFLKPSDAVPMGEIAHWSPQGHNFAALAHGNATENKLLLINPDKGIEHIFTLPVSEGGVHLVWSSDGQYVAVRISNNDFLSPFQGVFGIDGSALLPPEPGYSLGGWSADGQELYLLKAHEGEEQSTDLIFLHVNEKRYETVRSGIVSPMVSRILDDWGIRDDIVLPLYDKLSQTLKLEIFNLRSRKSTLIVENVDDMFWRRSPDGKRLVIYRYGKNLKPIPGLIWVNADGSGKQEVIPNGDVETWQWIGGSKWLLYDVWNGNKQQIVMADADTGIVHQILETPMPNPGFQANLSPNGKVITAMIFAVDGLFIGQVDRSAQRLRPGIFDSQAIWSPDSSQFAIVKVINGGASHRLEILNPEGALLRDFYLSQWEGNDWETLEWTRCG
ncbi:MAG: hypothetical protein ABI947_24900 [Chloroflexota bacterium]